MQVTAITRVGLAILTLTSSCRILHADDRSGQYLVEPGDVLSLNVVGVPELTTRLPVGIDGTASFPLVGQVTVAGQTITQARSTVQRLMPDNPIHRTTADGSVYRISIAPADIGLSIEEYRPIYVNGDVARPGEQAFRPGLTIRRAIAGAGGYDIMRFKVDNPFLQLSDFRSEYESLCITYTRQQGTLARLQSEIDNKTTLNKHSTVEMPISRNLSQEIITNEQKQLEMNNLDFNKETAYLSTASAHESERAHVLSEQKAKEAEGVNSDTADLQRYEELFKKGAIALPSLADARRTVLLSSTRELQTTALLASVQREKGDLDRRLDRLGDTRRSEVLRNILEITTQIAETRSKLQAVSEKLRYTGMLKSQLVRGVDGDPKISVIHSTTNSTGKSSASLDTLLLPGDTVEIALDATLNPSVDSGSEASTGLP